MSRTAVAQREEPLANKAFARDGIFLKPAAAASRLSLRVGDKGLSLASKTLGFALPDNTTKTTSKGDVHCLWIGPDEWMVIAPENAAILSKFISLGNDKLSAVDISHRNTAIIVSGRNAGLTINSGCPQDLDLQSFAIGYASRTILGKAEIIIYRTGEFEFRIECWRSFSQYVWAFLVDAAKSV